MTTAPSSPSSDTELRPPLVTLEGAAHIMGALVQTNWCNRREHIVSVVWETADAMRCAAIDRQEELVDDILDETFMAQVDLVQEAADAIEALLESVELVSAEQEAGR